MKVFKNAHGEIRCGWPIAAILASSMTLVPMLLGVVNSVFGSSNNETDLYLVALMLIQYALLIGATILLLWLFYRRHIKQIGFNTKGWMPQMALGLAFGAASITIIVAVLLISGAAKLSPFSAAGLRQGMFWFGLLQNVCVGFWEETISRGFMMTALKTTRVKPVIVLLPAAYFSLMHIMNNNVTFFSLANIALIGVLFAFLLIKTGRLWAPIGFHIAWNFVQGYIFGIPISGSSNDSALLNTAFSGPDWLTGGAFGAEGGAACTLIIILGMLFVHFALKPPRNPQEFWSMDGGLPLTRTQVQTDNSG